jgi:hypothetical protein
MAFHTLPLPLTFLAGEDLFAFLDTIATSSEEFEEVKLATRTTEVDVYHRERRRKKRQKKKNSGSRR